MVSRDLKSNLLPLNAPELNVLTPVVASATVPVAIIYPHSFPLTRQGEAAEWLQWENARDGFLL